MKRFTLVFLGVCLAVGVLCAGGQQGQAAISAEKKEMTIAWWGSQNRHDRTIKTIELYMEKNPNVEITYEFAGWRDYWTKMTTMAAGGMLPDVIQMDYAKLSQWQGKDLLIPLDDYVNSGTIDMSEVAEAVITTGQIKRRIYAISLGMNSQSIIKDVEAFEKAGIPLPEQNWTWDEFEAICLQLHDKLGIFGISCGLWNPHVWKSLHIANGEWVYAEDGNSLAYKDDSLYVNHMKMVLRLIEAGAHPERDVEIGDCANCDDAEKMPIVTGKGAMAYTWSNLITAIASAAGEGRELSMTHLPRLRKDGPPANYVKPSMLFAISVHAKNPVEAAKFIDFFTNDIEANKILMAERGVPIAAPVRDALEPFVSKPTKESFRFLGRVANDASPIPPADPPEDGQIVRNVIYPQVVDPVAFGKISPEEGAALLRTEANKILQSN
jgi:multiple sugar transport system substrate-binding protein